MLSSYEKPTMIEGDQLQAKAIVTRPLVVLVRELRSGVKTKFNSNPNESGYKPDGQDGVVIDVADLTTGAIYVDVMWLNGAIVDGLGRYVGHALPVKLSWTNSKSGNAYLAPEPLEGNELAAAQQWAAVNPTRFDDERAARMAQAQQSAQQPAGPAPVAHHAATFNPIAAQQTGNGWAQAQQPAGPIAAMPHQLAATGSALTAAAQPDLAAMAGQQQAQLAAAGAPVQPQMSATSAAAPGTPQAVAASDPAIAALLAQVNGGQQPGA